MRLTRFGALAAALLLFAGCDQNAFTEDYPDPGTEGLPPYVAFDVATLSAAVGVHFFDQAVPGHPFLSPEQGTYVVAVGARTQAFSVRLPMALEENVTVSYQVTTDNPDLEIGTHFVLEVEVWEEETLETGQTVMWPTNQWEALPASGTFDIFYNIQSTLSFRRALRVRMLGAWPNPDASDPDEPVRHMHLDITGVQAESGRTISVGRLPGVRDTRLTFARHRGVAVASVDCPDMLSVGQTGTFTANVNDDVATGPLSFEWAFGDGNTASGIVATHAYAEAGEYIATFTAQGIGNAADRSCPVLVTE